MTGEQLVRDALERGVSGATVPEPDVARLVAAGRALRIRRAGFAAAVAAVVVAAVVGLSVAWTGGRPSAVDRVPADRPTTWETTTATLVPVDLPFVLGGKVHRGRDVVDLDAPVAEVTVLLSGFVWVEGETTTPRIVFTGWDGGTEVIGRDPRPTVEPLSPTDENPRGVRRSVVGNPERNWLAYVRGHGTDTEVVVAHATGEAASVEIPDNGPEWVDVLAVDAADVYLRRCPAPRTPVELPGGDLDSRPASRDGCSIWQWRWQERGADLLPTGHSWVEPDGSVVQDVTNEVWAVSRPGAPGLSFVTPQGDRLSDADVVVTGNEGNGLSPDGRYWFSPGSRSVVLTATGEMRSLAAELARAGLGDGLRFVWVDPKTVLVVDDDTMTVCDASYVACRQPVDVGSVLLSRALLPVQ